MATATDVALDHYTDRQSLVDATGEVAGQMWSQVNPDHIADSWAEQLPELTSIVSGAQLGAARQADRYTTDALEAEGVDSEAVAAVDPTAFSGSASDGRGLMALLTNPVVVTLMSIQDGMDVARALFHGRSNLDMMVRTQVADAGRAADQVSLTTRPKATGYVRVAVGKTCARCLILAGREYKWNAGFQRHPRCDCIGVPRGIAQAGRLLQDPRRIYDSMSQADRVRAGFTRADQLAIEHGADLNQVVNAHRGLYTAGGHRFTTEGNTRRGFARARLGKGKPRITPDEIFQAAGDSRDEALRLLYRNGYLLDEPVGLAARAGDVLRVEGPVGAATGSFAAGRAALPPAGGVRPSLTRATSIRDLQKAAQREAKRITGRRIDFNFGDAVNADNAKEIAEGTLRVLEEFPNTQLGVRVGGMTSNAAAEANTATGLISIAPRFAESRNLYAQKWEAAERTAFHRRQMFSPAGTTAHEASHAVHFQYDPMGTRRKVSRLMGELAERADLDVAAYVHRELGGYAIKHLDEAIAQGMADALVSAAPSELSVGILRILREQYRAGRNHVPRSALPQIADLSGLTVKQLQDLARVRGIAFTARTRKPELLRLLEESGAAPVIELPRINPHDLLAMGLDELRTAAQARNLRFTARTSDQRLIDLIGDYEQGRPVPRVLFRTERTGRDALAAAPIDAQRLASLDAVMPSADAAKAQQAFAVYRQNVGGAQHRLNEDLRAGVDGVGARDAEIMREAMRHSPLTDDVLVYRGGGSGRRTFGSRLDGDMTGYEWTDRGFLSVTVDRLDAEQFVSGPEGILFRMSVPKGTHAMRISGVDAGASRMPEGELLLGDGQRLRVVADKGVIEIGEMRIGVPRRTARVLDVEIVPVTQAAPEVSGRAVQRAAARERNRLIESSQGTARLLAEVDELLAKKADIAVIRQRLDPALIQPEQVFAGADRAALDALRKAADTGDVAKVRSAITRASTKAKLKPISRAGAKAKFDPELMEGVGGLDIRAGAQVVIVRRGASVTLTDGSVIQLTKAQVTTLRPRPDISGFPSRGQPSLREFMDEAPTFKDYEALPLEERYRIRDAAMARIAKAVDGEYGGLEVRVKEINFIRTFTSISGDIVDPATGRKVGKFSRHFSYDDHGDGSLVAHHDLLQIGRDYRGSGFAERFNQNLYEWYRRSGVSRVELTANIDVGGYAWAVKGFDFLNERHAQYFVGAARLRVAKALKRPPAGLTATQIQELDDYLARLDSGEIPTRAFDISQFGRLPGQGGRDAVWAGKWLMMNRQYSWEGVLYL